MNSKKVSFQDLELCKTLNFDPPEPGKRIYRVLLSETLAVKLSFETELEVSRFGDLQNRIPSDQEIETALLQAAGMIYDDRAVNSSRCHRSGHRGAKD